PGRLHRSLSNPALQRASGLPGGLEQDRGGRSGGRRRGDPQPRTDPESKTPPDLGITTGGAARSGAGRSAAPAMTRQKAVPRAPISAAPDPIGSWKTMMPPMIA